MLTKSLVTAEQRGFVQLKNSGVDADVYDPMRHHPDRRTLAQTQAFMGFGVGRLKCVASVWAPQAASLIVAAVCAALERGFMIREGQVLGGREGWVGWQMEGFEEACIS